MKLEYFKINVILFLSFACLVFGNSCKKDSQILTLKETVAINKNYWLKTSDFKLNNEFYGTEIYDFSLLESGNLALLSDKYYVFDSNLNVIYNENLYQSIPDFLPKRLSNPIYSNQKGISVNETFINLNYFNSTTGFLNSRWTGNFNNFINVPNKGYCLLQDDKIDNVINKSLKLYRKVEFDSSGSGKSFNVLSGNDKESKLKNFEIVFAENFNRISSTKNAYLLYNPRSYMLKFLNPSLQATDTNIYKDNAEKVFATNDKFYIQTDYNLFSTTNGLEFEKIPNYFKAKCLLNNDSMFGVIDKKTCILNLNNGSIQYLPVLGLNENIILGQMEVISFDNKIVLFTREGVFQIKY